MLVEFSVKNFGPIKDKQTLSMLASSDTDLENYYVHKVSNLRLLKLAVIYGSNASGKTTVLKALDFLRRLVLFPLGKKTAPINFSPFLFDENSQNKESWMQIIFIQEGIKYDYEISFTRNCVLSEILFYYPNGRKSEFYSRSTDTGNEISHTNWGSTVKISSRDKSILEGNTLWNEPVLAAFSKSNIQSNELRQVFSWFFKHLQGLVINKDDLFNIANRMQETSEDDKKLMVDFIKKADVQINDMRLELSQTSVNINKANPNIPEAHAQSSMVEDKTLFFYHKIRNIDGTTSEYALPSDLQSSGTNQYYGLTGLLTNLINKNILSTVDEIETSLHPDLMKHFILTFLANAKQSQLILTTHNLFFLEEKDILRKDAVWFTQKKEDGSTELYSLADFDSSVFRKNTSIINAYKIGKLGAKPNLGSIFIESE